MSVGLDPAWNRPGSKIEFSEERGLDKIRLCWGEDLWD